MVVRTAKGRVAPLRPSQTRNDRLRCCPAPCRATSNSTCTATASSRAVLRMNIEASPLGALASGTRRFQAEDMPGSTRSLSSRVLIISPMSSERGSPAARQHTHRASFSQRLERGERASRPHPTGCRGGEEVQLSALHGGLGGTSSRSTCNAPYTVNHAARGLGRNLAAGRLRFRPRSG